MSAMLQYPRPESWGKAWSLHRRQAGTDSYGDPTAIYDMDTPDYSAQAGESGAVAWQTADDGAQLSEPGENALGSATGRLFDSSVEVDAFDRVVFDGAVWEVQSVEIWPSFRTLNVRKIAWP